MTYDGETALVVVDVQNDFADPDGSLYVAEGDKVVGGVNDEIERALAAGALVVYTQDWHPSETSHFNTFGGEWPVHCVQGTWGAALHPDLVVTGEIVRKGVDGEDGYSGFTVREMATGDESGTGLDDLLKARDIDRVVVAGLATDYCVKETALDALRLGYEVVVLSRAARGVERTPGDTQRALDAVAEAGGRVE